MKNISFAIEIHNKSFSGYLIVNDLHQPPNNYLVFMENHMVGELMCRYTWTFTQWRWRKVLGKLTNEECNEIAEYLSKVADMFYEEKNI